MKRIKLLLFTVILLCLSVSSQAADINAASCSDTDVQAAIDAAQDGDRVLIPPGTCDWDVNHIIEDKGITLQGAGIGVTVITDDTLSGAVLSIFINSGSQSITRVTGLTIDRNNTDKGSSNGSVNIIANASKLDAFRIYDIEIINGGGRLLTMFLRGWEISGLVDNVRFHMPSGGSKAIEIDGTSSQEHQPFSRPFELGSEKFVFIEDCTFDFDDKEDGALDAFGGARYVFRHNTVNNTNVAHHGADSGNFRGVHSFEIYENTFNRTAAGNIRSLYFRSGSGVVFNNTLIGNYEFPQISNFRSRPQSFGIWGACDGTSIWDENQAGMNGYACLDQIGHVFTENSGGSNTLEGLYYWNNTLNGAPTITIVPSQEPQAVHDHLVDGRDFFSNTNRPNYTPFTYPHPLRNEVAVPASYVDNSGSPSCSDVPGNGSEAAPWCTIEYGAGQISGGDTLYVKNGTYAEAVDIFSGSSGSPGNPTIISAFPGHTPIVDNGFSGIGIFITGASYITLQGFTVTNMGQGIFVVNSNNIVVKDNTVNNIEQEGIRVRSPGAVSFDILIEGNTVFDTGLTGNGEGVYIGEGGGGDNTNNVTVRNNLIHDTPDEAIEFKEDTHDNIAEDNTIYNCLHGFGATTGCIEVNETVSYGSDPNHLIRNNIIYASRTGIRLGTGATAYNNVIYNLTAGHNGIYVDNRDSDSYTRVIYHNTIDLTSSNAVVIAAGTTDVKNNIGPTTPNNIATSDTYYVDKAGADYHLVAGTAPINAGLDLTATVPTDIEGNSRSVPPDLGAYEHVSGPRPDPPTNLGVIVR